MDMRAPKLRAILTGGLVMLALAALPAARQAEAVFIPPGTLSNQYQIQAVRVAAIDVADPVGPANNPNHRFWARAPVTIVPLKWKVAATFNTALLGKDTWLDTQHTRVLMVRAIHDGATILFNTYWTDASQDNSIADTPLFHDALGIGIAYPESLYPGCSPGKLQPEMIHMGTPCNGAGGLPCCPMNIMFWRADKAEVENIVANSPGSANETVETDLGIYHTFQAWNGTNWTVIIGRPLIGPADTSGKPYPGGNLVDLPPGATLPIVFANWDGARQERNGLKYIGTWGTLIVQP